MSDGPVALTSIRRAYEAFMSGTPLPDAAVRSVVRESWMRSRSRGATAADAPGPDADDPGFNAYRDAHPMTAVRPLVRSLMLDDLTDTDVVVALSDQNGRLLWVEGDSRARDAAARINFVEGSVWSEDRVGTNAPGLALATGRAAQVLGPEHFAESVQNWNCAAVPVRDPRSNRIVGVIDVTGGDAVAAPFALSAVRSVVAAVERDLAASSVNLADPATFESTPPAPRLTALGDGPCRWTDAANPEGRPMSRRHAEILLLLQTHPEGLGTEALAMALAEEPLDPVTVRAEISRLRRDLGRDAIASRPYRLLSPVSSDVGDLRKQLADGGGLAGAVTALGRGGVLAESTAPGIVELFEELREDLRSRILAENDVTALLRWTDSVHGRDDGAAWNRLAALLPTTDPQRAVAAGRARLVDRRYGR
ncbi:MAG: transcriptional regulator [Gordonia sp. (in: high G+C Gram-positive bacteria)]